MKKIKSANNEYLIKKNNSFSRRINYLKKNNNYLQIKFNNSNQKKKDLN